MLRKLLCRADLADATDRRVLADALDDEAEALEAKLLRATHLPVRLSFRTGVRPRLTVAHIETDDDGRPLWLNCGWGDQSLGGCRVETDGECLPYRDSEFTGGLPPCADFYRRECRLDLTEDEADELTDWLVEESLRVCEAALQRYEDEEDD